MAENLPTNSTQGSAFTLACHKNILLGSCATFLHRTLSERIIVRDGILLRTAEQDQQPHGKGDFFSPGFHRFGTRAVAQEDIRKITTLLIAGTGLGGQSYPTLPSVGIASHVERCVQSVAQIIAKEPQPLKKFASPSARFERKIFCFCARMTPLPCTILASFSCFTQILALRVRFSTCVYELRGNINLLSAMPKSVNVLNV